MHLRPWIGDLQDKKEDHQIFNAWCGFFPATRQPALQKDGSEFFVVNLSQRKINSQG